MSIAEVAAWLDQSSLGVTIAESDWLFPTIETVHVIAIALVVGSIVALDLRLLGLSWQKRAVTEVVEDVLPLTWICFVIAVVAGALMFVSAARKYAADLPFQLKMILLVLAGVNMAIFHTFTYPRVRAWNHQIPTPRGARIAAALSLLFWIVIVACGRLVGFTTAHASAAQVQAPSSTIREPEEYGEFLARPEELSTAPTNHIVKSLRLNQTAMALGKSVYARNCASCHGEDLKGLSQEHTPDLTDGEWRFSGDDLESGGRTQFPSDVEWTVRYGIRSGNSNARGIEADMLAYDPQYRSEEDKKEFGSGRFLQPEEVDDVVEYVLQLSRQAFDAARAARGKVLFHDTSKGNCYDCHGEDATGIPAIGSTNLTRKDLYLYGSDRTAIRDSINKGRRGVMPAFDTSLKPEELKVVSVYVFSRARK